MKKKSRRAIYLPAVPYGNHGCQGGNMYNTFLYIVSNDGVCTADSYPFKGKVRENGQILVFIAE